MPAFITSRGVVVGSEVLWTGMRSIVMRGLRNAR
jgi:hypothetical protein